MYTHMCIYAYQYTAILYCNIICIYLKAPGYVTNCRLTSNTIGGTACLTLLV